MTAYLAIIGSLPTVYLWIVKERKKEEELKNKQQEINQIKVSELNKVYVDAVINFITKKLLSQVPTLFLPLLMTG